MKKTALVVLSLLMALAFQSDPSKPINQECNQEEMNIGTAQQGGYAFDYQSRETKNDCRNYRVRNHPGKLLTPVLWKTSNETFMDLDIPACAKSSQCNWINRTLISKATTLINTSTLSYGVNADEYTDSPDAYQKRIDLAKFPPITTIIEGTVGDMKGQPIGIKVRVSSSIEGNEAPYTLIYRFSASTDLQVPIQILAPGASSNGIGFLWEAAASRSFLENLRERRITLVREAPIEVRVKSPAIQLNPADQLMLLQGQKRLVRTSAPAYAPKE